MGRTTQTRAVLVILLAVLGAAYPTFGDNEWIKSSEAIKYVGQKKTVCGKVASTFFALKSRGQPTFLNLDKAHPNQLFTVVIWGSDRIRFREAPEKAYSDKRICVTGAITTHRSKPQIIVSLPSQIQLKRE